jgi:hypothetical protein
MRKFLSLALLCGFLIFPLAARAGAFVLSGKGGEKVTLESAIGKEKGDYYIRLDNTDSPWDGKTFIVKRSVSQGKERYAFTYTVDLSSGPMEHTYQPLVEGDTVLSKGSEVPVYTLFFPGGDQDGMKVALDQDASAALQKGALAKAYKEAPYTPEVE